MTDINNFYQDFGGASDLTMLGEINDPNNPTSLTFNTPINASQEGQVILVAEGVVPEPLTLSIFGAGLAGVVALRRRKRANA